MGFIDAIKLCFRKYLRFNERAPRSEYWWWALFVIVLSFVASFLDSALFGYIKTDVVNGYTVTFQTFRPILSVLAFLVVFLPTLAVTVRRLHDTDRSAWWLLVWFIPLVGWLIMTIFLLTRGTAGPNRFGPDPLPRD